MEEKRPKLTATDRYRFRQVAPSRPISLDRSNELRKSKQIPTKKASNQNNSSSTFFDDVPHSAVGGDVHITIDFSSIIVGVTSFIKAVSNKSKVIVTKFDFSYITKNFQSIGSIKSAGMLIFFSLGILYVLPPASGQQQGADIPEVRGAAVVVAPTFDPLQPDTVDAGSVQFDPSKKVASFKDTIAGVPIVVSQQELSDKDKADDQFLLQVALASSITTEFQSDKGPVFIGANSEKQMQTIVFRYQDLLIFMQTQQITSTDAIISYINEL